jgi:hypothetical protein
MHANTSPVFQYDAVRRARRLTQRRQAAGTQGIPKQNTGFCFFLFLFLFVFLFLASLRLGPLALKFLWNSFGSLVDPYPAGVQSHKRLRIRTGNLMQLVQFFVPAVGRRVGVVDGLRVQDLTSTNASIQSIYGLVQSSLAQNLLLVDLVDTLFSSEATPVFWDYAVLLSASPCGARPYLLPPLDHPEPSRLLITGTGLSHLGSVQSRDQMHGGTQSTEPQTDSARMFAMGLEGGRPAANKRGVAPEWFYKGNGFNLRGPNDLLEIPAYALDGGEEPEIVGCYIIDSAGRPRRIGFALGNEWSDHATEKINYLYLAPSKLRTCAVGPSLQVTEDFSDIALRCTVSRDGEQLYESGELRSGERNMCHSLRNMEDHHFKYAQHRHPGDLHLHFFGTSRLSFGSRTWKYQPGDQIQVSAPGFCEPLVNTVAAGSTAEAGVIRVEPV